MWKKHGAYKTTEYRSWLNMRSRCNSPKNTNWKHYGGRGIKVCEAWDDFTTFLRDMGPRPDKHSLDRKDNDGNYEPGNCRWATATEQARKTRRTKALSFNGETLCVAEWSARRGFKKDVIAGRLKAGMSVEAAITSPPLKGDLHYRTKMTAEDKAAIKASAESSRTLASRYGVAVRSINRVRRPQAL